MADDGRSFSQSTEDDAKKIAQTGADAVKGAKAVAKFAAQAASGNVAGAAVTAIKDGGKIIKYVAIFLAFIILISVLFMYALPYMIYEEVNSYFSNLSDVWAENYYGGDSGRIGSAIRAAFCVTKEAIKDAGNLFSDVWGMVTGGTANSADSRDKDLKDENDLFVMQEESAEKDTLSRKLDACIDKVNARANGILDAIKDSATHNGAIYTYYYNQFQQEHGHDENAVFGGVIVTGSVQAIKKGEAVKLLSLYSVQTGGDIQDVGTAAFMKWLGYYNGALGGKANFDVGHGITLSVREWQGTCLPQYLVEQMKVDPLLLDATTEDARMSYYTEKMCPAVDVILVVDANLDNAFCMTAQTEVMPDIFDTIISDEDEAEPKIVTTYTYNLSVRIKTRSVDDLAAILGLWSGALLDEQAEGVA